MFIDWTIQWRRSKQRPLPTTGQWLQCCIVELLVLDVQIPQWEGSIPGKIVSGLPIRECGTRRSIRKGHLNCNIATRLLYFFEGLDLEAHRRPGPTFLSLDEEMRPIEVKWYAQDHTAKMEPRLEFRSDNSISTVT